MSPFLIRNLVVVLIAGCLGFPLRGAQVSAWGQGSAGQTNVPADLDRPVMVAAGASHSAALLRNGSVRVWGDGTQGQTNVPPAATNLIGLASGDYHLVGLTADGRVIAWGYPSLGATNVPAGLSNVVSVAAGRFSSLALTADGKVRQWGLQSDPPRDLARVVSVAAGAQHAVALRDTGRAVSWGDNTFGQISGGSGFTNIIAVAAGSNHTVALLGNGTVVAWGGNGQGQTNVPAGLSNVVGIAAGGGFSLAMKSNGTLVGWGTGASLPGTFPGITGAVAVAAGPAHALIVTTTNAWPRWNPLISVTGRRNELVSQTLLSTLAGAKVTTTTNFPGLALNPATSVLSGTSAMGGALLMQFRATNAEALTVRTVRVGVYPFVSFLDAAPGATNGFDYAQSNVVQVATWGAHTVGVRANGTVAEWGTDPNGTPLASQPAGLSNVVDVVVGDSWTLALKQDGTLAQWGSKPIATNFSTFAGVVSVKAVSNWASIVTADGVRTTFQVLADAPAITTVKGGANIDHSLLRYTSAGLDFTGTVTAAVILTGGKPFTGKVVRSLFNAPNLLYALTTNGTVLGILDFYAHPSNSTNVVPVNLGPQVALACGDEVTASLAADGSVLCWRPLENPGVAPALSNFAMGTLGDVAQIAGGRSNFVAMRSGAPPMIITSPTSVTGQSGVFFSHTVATSAPCTNFSIMGLPPGMTFGVTNGLISGTVTGRVESYMRITARNTDGVPASRIMRLFVPAPPGSPPTNLTFTGSNVVEHAPAGTVVGTLNALDPDGGPLTYTLVGGTGSANNDLLGIVSNEVRVVYNVNYETVNPLLFRVRVTDNEDRFIELACSVPVVNLLTDDDDYDGLTEAQELAAGTNPTKTDSDNDGAWDATELQVGSNPLDSASVPPNYVAQWVPQGIWGPMPSDLTNATAVAAGKDFCAVLLENGAVRMLGFDTNVVPAPATATNLIQVAAGYNNVIGLRRDGTVLAWGANAGMNTPPSGLSNVVQVAASRNAAAALRADGTIAVWGTLHSNIVTDAATASNAVSIALGGDIHLHAVLANGTLRVWGSGNYGLTNPPVSATGWVGVAVTYSVAAAFAPDGKLTFWGLTNVRSFPVPPPTLLSASGGNESLIGITVGGGIAWPADYGQSYSQPLLTNITSACLNQRDTMAFAVSRVEAPRLFTGPLRQLSVGSPCQVTLGANGVASNWSAAFLPGGLTFDPATGRITGTPSTAGYFNTVITATLRGEVLRTILPLQVLAGPITSYAAWTTNHFGAAAGDPAISGAEVDTDADGVANLMEYLSAGDPTLGDPQPGAPSRVRVGGNDYLSLTFDVDPGVSDASWSVEVSGDLVHWTSGPNAVSWVSSEPVGLRQRVTLRDNTPMSGNAQRFIRVRAQTPPF